MEPKAGKMQQHDVVALEVHCVRGTVMESGETGRDEGVDPHHVLWKQRTVVPRGADEMWPAEQSGGVGPLGGDEREKTPSLIRDCVPEGKVFARK